MPPCKPILLIEDDQDYERLIREVLGSSEMFEVRSASSLAAGLGLIEQCAPEVILVDLNLADSSGYETFLCVRERASGIPIIVLTSLDDDQTAVQAVQDGAQDYLVKSLTQPKLIARCLNMAITRQSFQLPVKNAWSSSSGVVLSFFGSKGGVGASTTALNVAALLTQNGFETIAIELQAGRAGTFPLYLETEPRCSLDALCQKPAETITAADLQQGLPEPVSGLRLLCPGAAPSDAGTLSAEHVHAILCAARRAFRFVVLDLAARLDDGVREALKLSDSITLMVDREASSVYGGAAVIQQIRTAAAPAKEVSLAVVDRTGLGAPLPLADIKARLKMHPLAMIPSAAAAIALSQSARTPLVLLYPDDPFSLAHFELAEHLLPPSAAGLAGARMTLSRKAVWRTIPETTYG